MPGSLLQEFASHPALLYRLLRTPVTLTPERFAFGGDPCQYALVFAPQPPARELTVFYIHGGGWNSGSPDQFAYIGQWFARAGYRCVMPGYRKAPAHRFPAQIEDVCSGYLAALRALETAGAAPKMAVVGSSSGAHLGALLCCDAALQRRWGIAPRSLLGFAGLGGPYDLGAPRGWVLRTLAAQLFGPAADRTPGDPIRRLAAGQTPPLLLLHGRGDAVVDYRHALAFAGRARELGVPVELFTVPPKGSLAPGEAAGLPPSPGDSHSLYTAGLFLADGAADPTLRRLLRWLAALG